MHNLSAFRSSLKNNTVSVDCGDYAGEFTLPQCGWTPIELSGNRKGFAAKVRVTHMDARDWLAEQGEDISEATFEEQIVFAERYSDQPDYWVVNVMGHGATIDLRTTSKRFAGDEEQAAGYCSLLTKKSAFIPVSPIYREGIDGHAGWHLLLVELIED